MQVLQPEKSRRYQMMNKPIYLLLTVFLLPSCQRKKLEWSFDKKIVLDESVRPLGLANGSYGIWISDPDNDRVININEDGETQQTIDELNRPMHIEMDQDRLLIPNFSVDSITIYNQGIFRMLSIADSLDAPSGISTLDGVTAIADFYNHRVLLVRDGDVVQIGSEGRTDGLLYYPTDVKLHKDKVVVADAYNNRVQVFDQSGNFIRVIGWQENIKVAAGIDVFDDQIFVTDFYGNRLLIYDFEGNIINTLVEPFNKPTDIVVLEDKLYVANYGENSITVFER